MPWQYIATVGRLSLISITPAPDGKLVKSNIVSNTVSRESREKTFTINLRQKKAEIKQLLAPLLCLCLVEEINGRRKKSDLLYPAR